MNLENFNLPWKKTNEDTSETISTPKQEFEDYDSIILNSVPSRMRNHATHLLQLLKKTFRHFKLEREGRNITSQSKA